ncbi:hypothetical protein BH09VER1_BH09VER1_49590 [soil metagenome]
MRYFLLSMVVAVAGYAAEPTHLKDFSDYLKVPLGTKIKIYSDINIANAKVPPGFDKSAMQRELDKMIEGSPKLGILKFVDQGTITILEIPTPADGRSVSFGPGAVRRIEIVDK